MSKAAAQLSPVIREALPEWADFANHLADAARNITLNYFRKEIPTKTKADSTPVTQADKETEETIRRMITARFPDHGVYGEEYGMERENASVRWVIDPIDGTRAFIAGVPTFVTLISLTVDGLPVMGIIDQPCKQERWQGVLGETSTFNMVSLPNCRAIAPLKIAEARLGTTDATLFSPDHIARFQKLQNACGSFQEGGDGYLYANLAGGLPHLVCESGLKPHDFCALAPIVNGAGGVITDWWGQPLHYNSAGDVLASSHPDLHQQALDVLQS